MCGTIKEDIKGKTFYFPFDCLEPSTLYILKVRIECHDEKSEWSEEAEFTTPEDLWCCVWKECPDNVDDVYRKYSLDEKNPRVATKTNDDGYCTIIGNTPLPHNKVTSWNIKILKSRDNNGNSIWIGIAPSDIDLNQGWNGDKCGWYFCCWDSTLCSGPPHNYVGKEYGPRKGTGKYVHTGDNVGVVMDTAKGELSFVLNGVNHGVAYKGIPLDKPLVPCVLLLCQGDSVELII